ncbi:hypothetical protein ZIOFF_037939 [Zingiber officinale]|uniref:NAD-dependent epimerase/dehydratase domain-containing protein n=1 Tax=Zingiber officinale TaxID=94328 RepID=A0A8J5GFP5_ZINOF|nr:hypothetical protein ZIOFF_037939 [Zingiber officinale]
MVVVAPETSNGQTVCVTGAGGFIASWLVKLLLEKGYTVKGTVKNPGEKIQYLSDSDVDHSSAFSSKSKFLFLDVVDDSKNDHLKAMEGAAERFTLSKADLLDYDALLEAIHGCHGVFHIACPVTDDPVSYDCTFVSIILENFFWGKRETDEELCFGYGTWKEQVLEPAVRGTRNVINAAAEAGTVRRLVFTSSIGAVIMDPHRGPENWYCYGKTVAEQTAWEVAREKGVELSVVNPVMVLGPLLQQQVNASAAHILKYLDGSVRHFVNAVQGYVDVRDVAVAHLRIFEAASSSAAGKRFICAERILHREDVVRALTKLFPEYPVPNK